MLVTTPTTEYLPDDILDFKASMYLYQGRSAQAVRRLKYSRSTSLSPFMAEQLAELARGWKDFICVPVPIHRDRLQQRGFNQAALLCEQVDFQELLVRNRATKPQVGLSREERLKNLSGAFTVTGDVDRQSILLVDDVVTSGQTARECARTLKAAGAAEVGILAFCGEAEPELQGRGSLNHNYE